jgi:transposase
MYALNLTPEQLDTVFENMQSHANERVRRKCMVIYLKAQQYSNEEIARLLRINEDTITNYAKKYVNSGLEGLLKENFYKRVSQLEPYREQLIALFTETPPHSVAHAIEMIAEKTGIQLKHSACRDYLKKLGLSYKRCGLVPGKGGDDEKQCQAQQAFHDEELQPRLEEAKQGKRTVLFVDAAHFVMGAFLGMLWCFVRILLPSSCGRKRYNVLGGYNPITHELVTVTNDSYINQEVLCDFLDKVAQAYAGQPAITLVLDNARYQKCQSVFEKAKALNIELLYLPAYSPNLNLIERLWRFVKKTVLYSKYYSNFDKFKTAIDETLSQVNTAYKEKMETLMTMKFQFFDKTGKCAV